MRQYFFTEQIQYVWVVWKIFGEFVRVDNNPFFITIDINNYTNLYSFCPQSNEHIFFFVSMILQPNRFQEEWRQKFPKFFELCIL